MIGNATGVNSALLHAEALLQVRNLAAAQKAFELAADQMADADRCAGGLWMCHMLRGDFAAAWQQSDGVRARCAYDPHRFWQGEPIEHRQVMLRCLHGFGDSVQMLRFLPLLQQRCRSVVVEVPPRMLDISPNFRGMGQVITWGEHAPLTPPAWDVQVEIMELPYLFRTTVPELSIAECYLDLPVRLQQETAQWMGTHRKPRVGLVWSTGEWNLGRAVPFSFVEELARDREIEFWNLQGGPEHDDWSRLPAVDNLRDAAGFGDGILKLAAMVHQMDLVITADTLAAHLAGAMGKPAWVVLQHAADWRWMHARSDSPWYRSLRLFRQPAAGDWAGAMQQVNTALARWKRTPP